MKSVTNRLFLALALVALTALPVAAYADGSKYSSDSNSKYSSDSESKYSSDSNSKNSSDDSSPDSSSSSSSNTIQSNCTAIDSSGMRVPGVWVPVNNVTTAAAQSSSVPEVQGVMRYRDVNAQ